MWKLVKFSQQNIPEADPAFRVGKDANPSGGANIQFCQIFQMTARIEKMLVRSVPLDSSLYTGFDEFGSFEYICYNELISFSVKSFNSDVRRQRFGYNEKSYET